MTESGGCLPYERDALSEVGQWIKALVGCGHTLFVIGVQNNLQGGIVQWASRRGTFHEEPTRKANNGIRKSEFLGWRLTSPKPMTARPRIASG